MTKSLRIFWLALILICTASPSAWAATATLSSSTDKPSKGDPFTLTVEVDTFNAKVPRVLEGKGYVANHFGTYQTSLNGVGSVSYRYRAMANTEGELEIAPVEVEVNGAIVATNSLKVTVGPAGSSGSAPTTPPMRIPTPGLQGEEDEAPAGELDEKSTFLRIIPKRETIYVGELVEVEMKAYVDASLPLTYFERELELKGEDFVFQPSTGPDVRIEEVRGRRMYVVNEEMVDGRKYNVFTFKTALTAVKPGEFTIDPITYKTHVRISRPRPQRNSRGSAIDRLFGDPFDDPFFDSLLPRNREIAATSEPLTLTVLPLPEEGRPANFKGAVGRFSIDSEVDKTELKVDDPLKVTTRIVGHGNFERINEVSADSGNAWKSYPAKSEFAEADEIKVSGVKTFEQVFLATAPTSESPRIHFSYFDPEKKEYVNLSPGPHPVQVTGVPKVVETPNPAMDEAALADGELFPMVAAAEVGSLLRGDSEEPFYRSPAFLALNTLGATGAVALAFVSLLATRRNSESYRIRRERRNTLAAQLRTLRNPSTDDDAFAAAFQQAIETTAPVDAVAVSAKAVVHQLPADDPDRETLAKALAWCEQRRWSAHSSEYVALDTETRTRYLQALEALVAKQRA